MKSIIRSTLILLLSGQKSIALTLECQLKMDSTPVGPPRPNFYKVQSPVRLRKKAFPALEPRVRLLGSGWPVFLLYPDVFVLVSYPFFNVA